MLDACSSLAHLLLLLMMMMVVIMVIMVMPRKLDDGCGQ